jgi:hypothetical protein
MTTKTYNILQRDLFLVSTPQEWNFNDISFKKLIQNIPFLISIALAIFHQTIPRVELLRTSTIAGKKSGTSTSLS